jgi:hypothetical protein
MVSFVKLLRLTQFVVAVSVLTLTGPVVPPLHACATVSSLDASAAVAPPVFMQAEDAVILWDSQHQTEHFIRQAKMSTDSPDLGFLVPTPETPEIAVADPAIFDLVAKLGSPETHAQVVRETPWQVLAPVATGPAIQRALEGASAPVFGIPRTQRAKTPATTAAFSEQDIAGYHVTTLDPRDTQAVTAWLTQNGYSATPALQAWLHRYAEAGWMINAFRLDKTQQGSPSLTTRAFRLSFHTAKPYYPYSEPADRQQSAAASPGGRVLHVAVLSESRVAAAKADGTDWPGQLMYAGSSAAPTTPINDMPWLKMAKLDDAAHAVSNLSQLTTFVDKANPRPGTADLYFTPDANQAPFRASVVDPALGTVRQLDWSNPIADAATLVALVLIPGVPLYLGWFIYSRNRSKHDRDGAWRPLTAAMTTRQKVMGVMGMLWGAFYGIVIMYRIVVASIGRLGSALAPGNTLAHWQVALVLDGLGILAAVAMVAGVIYCGVQAWRTRPANPAPLTASQTTLRRKLQETYALAALFAGGIGLALMFYVVYQLTA